jgi:lysophospholipase L1-like esterase
MTYRALISAAAATGAEVTVATIAPVGNGFAFGDNVFDPALIKRFNVEIRKIAMELHANVAEIDRALAGEDGFLPHDFTMDGVHLTRTGYQPWKRTLEKSTCIE